MIDIIINNIPEAFSFILATVGVLITIVGLPGIWLVYIGMFIWSWGNSFTEITWPWLILFLLVSVVSSFIDNISVLLGAKKYGASTVGIVGAVVGLIIGALIANIPGLLIGAFLGAVAAEMLFANKKSDEAVKAGFGTLIGFVLGNVIKLFVALALIFAWWLLAR